MQNVPLSSQATVVRIPFPGSGRICPVFRRRKAPVPYVFFPCPALKQPWPNSAACWSPATPRIEIGAPKCSRPAVPKSPLEVRTSGSTDRSTSKRSHNSWLHARSPMSYRSVRDALVGSVACTDPPVSFHMSHVSMVPASAFPARNRSAAGPASRTASFVAEK